MKKLTSYTKGFTLIELLVVIAIIGILASVVLVSLGSARSKGKGASAQESMVSMRAAAELLADNSGNYPANLCTVGGVFTLITAVQTQVSPSTVTCAMSGTTAWGAIVPMTNVGGTAGTATAYFCVDSTGFAGGRQTATLSGAACPAS